ncbi:GNAT family N-acetyltransferase [Ruminococcus albus]|uniref:Protein N-acetyltransferase, RimJ/RimL family n=1 Tax=Ruminococcus albus TaxID=1264 RepID=A0A1I1QRY6_RUMAL|nr:GNAT family N-acetyltransferase [Ruminococcus albus]SFD24886.1 Protein N-acetyltransferase, RimJ/RimL family [Ruminococcus albus]
MKIKTERLILRPICTKDLETTHAYASDRENCRFMVFLPKLSEDETLEFLRCAEEEWSKPKPGYYELAVVYEGRHIGGVSLYPDDTRTSAEIGWIIHPGYHKQGFGSEAASALMGFAFKELGIKHFYAHCDTENTASRRVMEKLGMTLTEEHGGRKNRLSDEERREYQYEISMI